MNLSIHYTTHIYASKEGYSSLFKSRLYDLFPSSYGNKLLNSYVTYIFTIYYYMSLCTIPF